MSYQEAKTEKFDNGILGSFSATASLEMLSCITEKVVKGNADSVNF